MAKIIISIEDDSAGGVGVEIAGDFEKDVAKCSAAQLAALEGIMFMLRDAQIKDEVEVCGGCCDGCEKDCETKGT